MRLVFLVMCGKVALWRYICVWLIAVSETLSGSRGGGGGGGGGVGSLRV